MQGEPNQPSDRDTPQGDERLNRIEEAHLFMERKLDDLTEQVDHLEKSFTELKTRLLGLEEGVVRFRDELRGDTTQP